MTTDKLIALYVTFTLCTVAAVAFYEEMRRRRFGPSNTTDNVFRCDECGYVYTDDPDVDRSRCPQCGRTNSTFKF